ncbi:helix-turn-helix transcriptional regulator [Candidatus Woesearchaeota archaeon]|nr:helix-turn-helix transcriptional regulator [Candidatus Woesearchaeota archaeon]
MVLVKKDLNASRIAEKIGVKRPYISMVLNGKRGLTGENAEKIYLLLDKDPSLTFLCTSNAELDIERHWLFLFQDYTLRLQKAYEQQPAQEKGNILGELEELVVKYESNSKITK